MQVSGAARHSAPESIIIIIEYLQHHYPGPRPLIPPDAQQALEVRLWDRILDNHVHAPMQAIVADHLRGAHGNMANERATLQTAYAMIDQRMASRTWLAGPDFSMADCAAAPALFYASTLQPFPDELPHLSAYFERLVQRPSFRKVIDQARPYFSFYPFAHAIPPRFRLGPTDGA